MPRRSVIRASDNEREAIAERLRAAAAEGRLLASELEERLGWALRARTLGELDELVRDLPGRRRVPQRRTLGTAVRQASVLAVALTAVVAVIGAVILFVTGLAFIWVCFGIMWLAFGRGRACRPHLRAQTPLRYSRRGLL